MSGLLAWLWIVGMVGLCYAALDTGNWVSLICLCLVALGSLDIEKKCE